MARIVLFGATGYTGRLIAEVLVRRGAEPLLAARSAASLATLAADLGGEHPTAVATAEEPASIARLLGRGDVLITTVGPFLQWGAPALDAAIKAGAHYLDTTGEAAFVSWALERRDREARSAGSLVLPAFGFDYVPGHLAGALALERAGGRAARLDVGYFFDGSQRGALSRGTVASAGGILAGKVATFRDGGPRFERAAARVGTYTIDGRRRRGVTLGSSEVLFLPRRFPELRELDVHQGGLGPLTRPLAAISPVLARPLAARGLTRISRRLAARPVHGPTAGARAKSGTLVVGVASDAQRRPAASVALTGPNVYDATAEIIAWAAERLLVAPPTCAGVCGPLDVFDTVTLRSGCAEGGIAVVDVNATCA